MKLWPVAPFFSLTFGIGEHTKHCSMSFLYSSTKNDMLQCFVCSLIPKVSEKKGATGQSLIRKEITSYRIGTLYAYMVLWSTWSKKSVTVSTNHVLPFAWAIYLRFSTFTFKMIPWEVLGLWWHEISQKVFPTFDNVVAMEVNRQNHW